MKKIINHLKENWIRHGFETLVVVVGILGAFTLNNWNEERKSEKIEIEYLRGVLADLKSDTAYFNYRIAAAENMIRKTKQYVKESYKEQESAEEFGSLISLLMWNSEQMTVQNTTYTELTSSGLLHLFRNNELKTSLIELYRHYDEAEKHIIEFNAVSADGLVDSKHYVTMIKYLFPDMYAEPRMYNEKEWSFINDPESFEFRIIEENALIYMAKYQVFLSHFQQLKPKAEALIEMINGELERRDP